MASSRSFSLEYSSSENELQATPPRFNFGDLPDLVIPSPFQSDSSACESPTSPGTHVASRPETPATPLSPGSSLGGEFSFINISSQTSDGKSGTPIPPRGKRYVKKRRGSMKKGQQGPPPASPVSEIPILKRHKIERPSSELFADMRFSAPLGSYPIKIASGDKTSLREMVVPTGNAICNLEILSLIFGQLNCTDRSCYGRLRLYEIPLDDGLQNFLLLKCTHCHELVAEFPATLPIGVSALDTINNNSLITKGKSEINQRALMAVHTTSASWEDFRLTCSLLDVKAPSRDMSKTQLTKFKKASVNVANNSMRIAGKQAYSQATPVNASESGLRDCAVSFDASWHRRGHYSNQGFAAAIDTDFGKVLDYALYDRVCYSCSKWPESRRSSCPDGSKITGPAIKTFALRTIKGPLNQWNHPVLLKSGEGPLISTTSRMGSILAMEIPLPSV